MAYTKPQVVIDLDEYNDLRRPKIGKTHYEMVCKEFFIGLTKYPRMDMDFVKYLKAQGIIINVHAQARAGNVKPDDITITLDPDKWEEPDL